MEGETEAPSEGSFPVSFGCRKERCRCVCVCFINVFFLFFLEAHFQSILVYVCMYVYMRNYFFFISFTHYIPRLM